MAAGSTAGALAFASASAFLRASASALAFRASSRSRSSASFASASARRRLRSSSRAFSSASRFAASSASRARAACSAFIRRSISASEMPAGRLDGSLVTAPVDAPLAAPGLGTTTRLRLVSTTTFFVRPWLNDCFTLPGREGAPRRPRGFLPSVSLM